MLNDDLGTFIPTKGRGGRGGAPESLLLRFFCTFPMYRHKKGRGSIPHCTLGCLCTTTPWKCMGPFRVLI